MGELVPISIVLGSAYFLYKIVEVNVRRNERILLVEKISELAAGDKSNLKKLDFNLESNSRFMALRWSLLVIGVGLGLFLAAMIDFNLGDNSRIEDVIYGSLVCLFGGLGLLIAYLIEVANSKKEKKEKKE